jgi:hypothetical protein
MWSFTTALYNTKWSIHNIEDPKFFIPSSYTLKRLFHVARLTNLQPGA